MNLKTMFFIGIAVILSGFAAIVCAEEGAGNQAGVEDADGNLRVPTDYRDVYEYLGTWSVVRIRRYAASSSRSSRAMRSFA
jgi:hypothetical protein